MKIHKVKVENYRLLKNFSLNLEDELSLVIGKNNTGKTSLLIVMDKFLNDTDKQRFSFDDFNIELKEEIQDMVEKREVDTGTYKPLGIKMQLLIKYDEKDNLANLNKVMMDLDPDHYYVLLEFGFEMDYNSLIQLRSDYGAFQENEKEKQKQDSNYKIKDLTYFLRDNLNYFHVRQRSLSCSKETGERTGYEFIDLEKENISLKNIINFQYISARRDVSNRDVNNTLSSQTSAIYRKSEETKEYNKQIEKFKDQLVATDSRLTGIYQSLFKDVVDKVKKFGGINEGESKINIESTLQHRQLLDGNTTVTYSHGGHTFPEYNNGLGYMNLISIIFEIEILIQKFKRTKNELPADINFLFIEEPEAHTHPQMQYVFIKNIKNLLREGVKHERITCPLQYIITTHSSHIVSESDYNDIRYLKRVSDRQVKANSLKELEEQYNKDGEEQNFRFLKQYLTLNKSELFFADKAILIEGDTERILLPAMMKKIDQENNKKPLLSQNISLVEVGAHSQIFEKFIDFIGIKTLIITDIDSAKNDKTRCKVDSSEATISTNESLKFFLSENLKDLKSRSFEKKRVDKKGEGAEKRWEVDSHGLIQIVYQTEEKNSNSEVYHARSFEDAFAHINRNFLTDDNKTFASLTNKHFKKFKEKEYDVYEFANEAIGSKPSFAIEILLNSNEDEEGNKFNNWQIPSYIKDGLLWLKKD